MAKKNHIRVEADPEVWVIGIASNEKIWKVCWDLNQAAQLNMSSGRQDLTSLHVGEFYVDTGSSEDFHFYLFENLNKGKKVSRLAKQFRLWLIVRAQREKHPDIPAFIENLKKAAVVSLAVDLSDEKDINILIP